MPLLSAAAVIPGLVDPHTHLIWAGDRVGEYALRAAGASYEEILKAGGGIYATTRATQAASDDQLLDTAAARAWRMLRAGVTTLEVKTGYGLTVVQELRMLRLIARLVTERRTPQRIHPTLLVHVVPEGVSGEDRERHVREVCETLIPTAAAEGLATAVDVFCDRGAYTLDETRAILTTARDHGLAIKAHAEQLAHTGATSLVAELGGLSADHLEQTTPADWAALASAGTVGTILPGATLILRKPFPDVRGMVDAGVRIAVATDFNPGSSPVESLWICLQLAVSLGGLTIPEALAAGTVHAHAALGNGNTTHPLDRRPRSNLGDIARALATVTADPQEQGRLAACALPDRIVLDDPHPYAPMCRWGTPPIREVWIADEQVYVNPDATGHR